MLFRSEFFAGSSGPERIQARSMLDIDPAAFVVVFVGRIIRIKGVAELVDAFSVFSQTRSDALLFVVGRTEVHDPIPDRTVRAMRQHPRVVQVGWHDDVRPFLRASDLLVLPSYREGLPNVLLQGAAYSLPMIASDIPGNRDVIEDGKTGILVPPKSVEALATAMLAVADNPDQAAQLGLAAHDRVVANYEQEKFWADLMGWYVKVLQG